MSQAFCLVHSPSAAQNHSRVQVLQLDRKHRCPLVLVGARWKGAACWKELHSRVLCGHGDCVHPKLCVEMQSQVLPFLNRS